MKEQKASDIAGGETTAKRNTNRIFVTADSSETIIMTSSEPTKLIVEGDTFNGRPKVAAALLRLGQDLTRGVSAVVASVAALALPPSGQSASQQQDQFQNQLNFVTTSDISMLPIDIGTNVDRTQGPSRMNANDDANQKKRKRSKSKTDKNEYENPPDFWHWVLPEENVGNWYVLCGRGGESNNYIGNKRYRKVIGEKKEEYRKIDVKQRKRKTDFVREIVKHINNCGGRFIDVTREGKYYVVTDDKARKKTSQALRETKELKWLVDSYVDDEKKDKNKKQVTRNKDVVCPFCKKKGHKTRIAKACLKHYEWLDINNGSTKTAGGSINNIGNKKNKKIGI